jgi:hypothetical protein
MNKKGLKGASQVKKQGVLKQVVDLGTGGALKKRQELAAQ